MLTSDRTRTNLVAFVLMAASVFVCSCGPGSKAGLRSSLSRFPDDLNDPRLELAGIFEDGWIGEAGAATLQQPAGNQVITVRGVVPRIDQPDFQAQVALTVGGRSLATQTVGVGDFRISAPASGGAAQRRVTVHFSATQRLPGGDGRLVGARLQFLGFEPPGPGQPIERSDIVRGSGIELGKNWGALETFQNETFRWVENQAQIRIVATKSGNATLSVGVAAGPGVGSREFDLQVRAESGQVLATVHVPGAGDVKFILPVKAGEPNEFRLHVNNGGKRIESDPRILNFRVFRLSLTPAP
jgi:hypothetical protein